MVLHGFQTLDTYFSEKIVKHIVNNRCYGEGLLIEFSGFYKKAREIEKQTGKMKKVKRM